MPMWTQRNTGSKLRELFTSNINQLMTDLLVKSFKSIWIFAQILAVIKYVSNSLTLQKNALRLLILKRTSRTYQILFSSRYLRNFFGLMKTIFS